MRRVVMRAVTAVSLALALMQAQPSGLLAAVGEDSVEFQDGAGNIVQSFTPGQTAAFYVKDDSLTTVGACTATWVLPAGRDSCGCPPEPCDGSAPSRRL